MIEIPQGWTNVIYHSIFEQFFDTSLSNDLIARGTAGKKSETHVTAQPCIRKEAEWYVLGNVESHSSFFTFHRTWHFETLCETYLVKAQKMGTHSVKHSVMLFTLQTTQQNAQQEFSEMIGQSCVKDHQESHQAIWQYKQMSVHRVTDRDRQQRRLDLIRSCVNFILQSPNKDELTKRTT